MKPLAFALFPVVALTLSGCAAHRSQLVLDPVGPPPQTPAIGRPAGTLVVFSAFDSSPHFNRSQYRRQYTNYSVLTADGQQMVRMVHNDSGKLAEGPEKLELPAGKYLVLARANGYGLVRVPVVIRRGQTTTLHLEGSVWWPASTGIGTSNPVRLPHQEIVGWRAAD